MAGIVIPGQNNFSAPDLTVLYCVRSVLPAMVQTFSDTVMMAQGGSGLLEITSRIGSMTGP